MSWLRNKRSRPDLNGGDDDSFKDCRLNLFENDSSVVRKNEDMDKRPPCPLTRFSRCYTGTRSPWGRYIQSPWEYECIIKYLNIYKGELAQ